ncbi:MAG: Ni/Fe-hydrogenase cytochrome b subunit [Ignavibacteriae bacterium]|jgi:Ni/Fe-hydrogenase subunit HybB-like protein|nr:Ni/Fe-hydrogenase cytochrome b subunit [Ignavibacteriota bacterium]
MKPAPVKHRFFTPGVIILAVLALNGLIFLAVRFISGLGAVTNLDNNTPWGLWIGVDVAAGVALAAGGFTSAALGHVIHREHYHAIVRPALLTALLGYTFVAFAVCVDIGRFYYIWHPLIMWNGNSALFEVGICVMIYMTVLYIEFLPIVTEKFMGKVNLPGFLETFNEPADKLLRMLNSGLSKTMFIFIIAGVVLSTLHQSSLGTLMVIAGQKMHPLWQTPVLPLLFLLSAIAVGFPMIIFESLIASRSFKMKPEMKILSRLGSMVAPILGVYLAVKIGDMFISDDFKYILKFDVPAWMFMAETGLIIIAFVLFLSKETTRSPGRLFLASSLVIAGVLLNRINNFIVAYKPLYDPVAYFPSFGEISVTVGCIALLVLIYRAVVIYFPVISHK